MEQLALNSYTAVIETGGRAAILRRRQVIHCEAHSLTEAKRIAQKACTSIGGQGSVVLTVTESNG